MSTPFPARRAIAAAALTCALLAGNAAFGSEDAPLELRFADGRFEPAQLSAKANAPFKVRVTNASGKAIEFESFELHRERVVPPGESVTVSFPALEAGRYKFCDDFDDSVGSGEIVVR